MIFRYIKPNIYGEKNVVISYPLETSISYLFEASINYKSAQSSKALIFFYLTSGEQYFNCIHKCKNNTPRR